MALCCYTPNKRVLLVPRRQKPAKLDSAKLSQTATSCLCSGCTCDSLALCAGSHSWAVCVTNVCHHGTESQRGCSWRDSLSNVFVVSVSSWLPSPSVDCNTHWTSWNLIAHSGVLATDLTCPYWNKCPWSLWHSWTSLIPKCKTGTSVSFRSEMINLKGLYKGFGFWKALKS